MGIALGAVLFAAAVFGAAALLRRRFGLSVEAAGCLGFLVAIIVVSGGLFGAAWLGLIR